MTSEVEQITPDKDVSAADPGPATGAAVSAASPGELLSRAREAKGLSVSELAAQTRLSRATLESLEKNEFGSSKPVFVRGYFRKCARVLEVSEEELISAYAAWTGTPLAPEPLAPIFVEPPEDYGDQRSMSGVKYWIGAGILIGAALWWFGSGGRQPTESGAINATPESTSQVTEDGESRTLTLQPPPALNQPEPVTATPDATPPVPAVTSATPEATAQPGSVQAEGATGESLEIRIERVASWVEINDADGKRLVYDLLQPGAQRQVSGKPPYQVILGNPGGVYLAMGGQQIDLKPYSAPGGTARLTLGGH